MLSGVAEPLYGHANALGLPFPDSLELLDAIECTSPGGIIAAKASAQRHRLTCDHRGGALPAKLGVFVHHPAHDSGVGINVRRRNVRFGSDEIRYLVNETAAQSFQLQMGQLLGIDDDAAFRAAVRYPHHGTLAVHPERERLHLAQVHAGMVADAPFSRAARIVVAHTVPREHAQGPIIHPNGDRNLKNRLWMTKSLHGFFVDIGVRRGARQSPDGVLEKIIEVFI